MPAKPVYLAAKLTAASREKLLSVVKPFFSKVFAEHVTLAYKPTDEEIALFEAGRKVVVEPMVYWYDPKCQCVTVRTTTVEGAKVAFRSEEEQPQHVTISVAEGEGPKYSKEVLLSNKAEKLVKSFVLIEEPLKLEAYLDSFPWTIKDDTRP